MIFSTMMNKIGDKIQKLGQPYSINSTRKLITAYNFINEIMCDDINLEIANIYLYSHVRRIPFQKINYKI
jgi:hypothetical protein